MEIVLIGIEAGLLIMFLYSFLWSRTHPLKVKGTGLNRFWRIFLPIGYLMVYKRRQSRRLWNELKYLYPSGRPEDVCMEYRAQKAGQVYALLLLCNAIAIFGLTQVSGSENIGYELERPVYGSEDQTEIFVVRAEGEEANVRVRIPRQEPTREQCERRLEDAELFLEEYVHELGEIHGDVQLPVRHGDVEIRYMLEDQRSVGEDGWIRWGQGGDWTVQASLTCGEYSRSCDLRMHVDLTEQYPFIEQVKGRLDQAEMTQTSLILPDTIYADGIVRHISWYTQDEKKEAGLWILLLWSIPICLIPLGRYEIRQKRKEKEKRIQFVYPNVLQKLTIFLGAGLSLQAAWERVVISGNKKEPLIEEMERTRIQMRHGMSPQEALRQFGERLHSQELRHLTSMLCRNLRRGDEFLLDHLKEMNHEAWESHKKRVRIQSAEAETKFLIPMFIMLIVILLIVLTPALLTLNA